MSATNLFSVQVTRTWSATMEALVWAEDRQAAINAAMAEEDLNSVDAWDDGAEAVAQATDPLILKQLPAKPDQLLLVPKPPRPGPFRPTWDAVDTVAEFMAFMDSEEAERLRLAAIERNNGQIALPMDVAA